MDRLSIEDIDLDHVLEADLQVLQDEAARERSLLNQDIRNHEKKG